MKYLLKRWALFLTVGLLGQALIYLLYPFITIWFRLKVRGKLGTKLSERAPANGLDTLIEKGSQDPTRDEVFVNHDDSHNAMIHLGFWSYRPKFVAREGLRRLVREDGGLKRRSPNDWPLPVSGDCLSMWTYAYHMFGGSKDDLKKVLKHYIKNCFGITHYVNGLVSARSSNSGINYVFDGYKGINQPCFGPQYYTSAALLAVAKSELGGYWHGVYWLHWLLMGGWVWWIQPVIHPKKDLIYYAQHISAVNLSVLNKLAPGPLHRYAMRELVIRTAPQGNVEAFLYAMAHNAGVLSEQERSKGAEMLKRIGKFWPQNAPTDDSYYNFDLRGNLWSMMGFHAKLLKNEKGWKVYD